MTEVIFFQVKDTQTKLQAICNLAQSCLENKEPLLILVQDKASLEFINNLLWRYPEESFLPHGLEREGQCIILAEESAAPEMPPVILNLCREARTNLEGIKKIYELEDLTSLEKEEAAKKRYKAYRELALPISYG